MRTLNIRLGCTGSEQWIEAEWSLSNQERRCCVSVCYGCLCVNSEILRFCDNTETIS